MEGTTQRSLYEQLGGLDAITAANDDFFAIAAADNRINHYFVHSDVPQFKRLLVDWLCELSGGPCTYTGRSMKEAHAGRASRTRTLTRS
jgi:hemoglobin